MPRSYYPFVWKVWWSDLITVLFLNTCIFTFKFMLMWSQTLWYKTIWAVYCIQIMKEFLWIDHIIEVSILVWFFKTLNCRHVTYAINDNDYLRIMANEIGEIILHVNHGYVLFHQRKRRVGLIYCSISVCVPVEDISATHIIDSIILLLLNT